MGLINVRRRIIHTLCAAGIAVAAGCATTPRKPAPISFDLALPGGLPAEVRTTGLDEADLLATYNEFMQHLLSTAPPRTLNILALSGGGAGGAFGAGALVGMTRRGIHRSDSRRKQRKGGWTKRRSGELGIPRSTLDWKIRRLKINRHRFDS